MDLFETIWNGLKKIWDFIKKIVVKILNFFKNIVNWFKDPERLKIIQEDKEKIAFAIKEKLATGSYNVVTGIFDVEKEEILTEHTVAYEAEELDKESLINFGNKDMIILR